MVSVDFVELIGAFSAVMVAFAAMVLGTTTYLNKALREDVSRQNDVLRGEVIRLIEVGTKEHDEFRQGLKRHDELFREISEKLGDLNGKVDVLIGLQRKQAHE